MRVDQVVSMEVLKVIEPLAIEAAVETGDQVLKRQSDGTRYEARLAARRYEAIDPLSIGRMAPLRSAG